jgi:hypothetical protein
MNISCSLLDQVDYRSAVLPPGAWSITVRPNGPGTDGHPDFVRKLINI